MQEIKLKNSKGNDGIPQIILLEGIDQLIEPMLFNKIYNERKLPEQVPEQLPEHPYSYYLHLCNSFVCLLVCKVNHYLTSLFTKRERWLIFSSLKLSCFLKSALLLNFGIQWYLNFLNLWNILTMWNKCIIRWFSFDVTTSFQISWCTAIHHAYSSMGIIKITNLFKTSWIKISNLW